MRSVSTTLKKKLYKVSVTLRWVLNLLKCSVVILYILANMSMRCNGRKKLLYVYGKDNTPDQVKNGIKETLHYLGGYTKRGRIKCDEILAI